MLRGLSQKLEFYINFYASEIKADHNTDHHVLFALLEQEGLLSYLIHKIP